jgi:hypothetical protein
VSELARYDDDERTMARLMSRAEMFASVPGLKKELQGNPRAVAAVMLSLQGEGLALTLRNINDRHHWIEGRATDSAQSVMAFAFRAGYRLEPVVRTAERAVVSITGPDGHRTEVEFNLADAQRSGHLNEWVEVWTRDQDRNRKVTWTVRVNGEDIPDPPWPEWVQKEMAAGRVKRFDAWWSYRTDMLYKSAAVRAVRIACPQVLLGGDDGERSTSTAPVRGSSGATELGYIEATASERIPADEPAADEPREWGPGEEPF